MITIDKKYLLKTVFIVVGDEEDEFSEIKIMEDVSVLLYHLSSIRPPGTDSIRVFHGVLCSSKYLPSSLNGKSVFVVNIDPNDMERGNVIEAASDDVCELATVIELAVNNSASHDIDIDDIYLLYGYQIETCLSIDEDDLDEEEIESSKIIANEARIVEESFDKS